MHHIEFKKLTGTLRRDAELWRKLGHPLSQLFVSEGGLWMSEQYALQQGCTSLEIFEPINVQTKKQKHNWAFKWSPTEDVSVWANLLRGCISLQRHKLVRTATSLTLPTAIVEAYLQAA